MVVDIQYRVGVGIQFCAAQRGPPENPIGVHQCTVWVIGRNVNRSCKDATIRTAELIILLCKIKPQPDIAINIDGQRPSTPAKVSHRYGPGNAFVLDLIIIDDPVAIRICHWEHF